MPEVEYYFLSPRTCEEACLRLQRLAGCPEILNMHGAADQKSAAEAGQESVAVTYSHFSTEQRPNAAMPNTETSPGSHGSSAIGLFGPRSSCSEQLGGSLAQVRADKR